MKSPHYGKTFPERRNPTKRYVADSACTRDGTFERYTRNGECCACVLRRAREQREDRQITGAMA